MQSVDDSSSKACDEAPPGEVIHAPSSPPPTSSSSSPLIDSTQQHKAPDFRRNRRERQVKFTKAQDALNVEKRLSNEVVVGPTVIADDRRSSSELFPSRQPVTLTSYRPLVDKPPLPPPTLPLGSQVNNATNSTAVRFRPTASSVAGGGGKAFSFIRSREECIKVMPTVEWKFYAPETVADKAINDNKQQLITVKSTASDMKPTDDHFNSDISDEQKSSHQSYYNATSCGGSHEDIGLSQDEETKDHARDEADGAEAGKVLLCNCCNDEIDGFAGNVYDNTPCSADKEPAGSIALTNLCADSDVRDSVNEYGNDLGDIEIRLKRADEIDAEIMQENGTADEKDRPYEDQSFEGNDLSGELSSYMRHFQQRFAGMTVDSYNSTLSSIASDDSGFRSQGWNDTLGSNGTGSDVPLEDQEGG
jgi:hypothetical protein